MEPTRSYDSAWTLTPPPPYGLAHPPPSQRYHSVEPYTDRVHLFDGVESLTILFVELMALRNSEPPTRCYIAPINTGVTLVCTACILVVRCTTAPSFSSACGLTPPAILARATALPRLSSPTSNAISQSIPCTDHISHIDGAVGSVYKIIL